MRIQVTFGESVNVHFTKPPPTLTVKKKKRIKNKEINNNKWKWIKNYNPTNAYKMSRGRHAYFITWFLSQSVDESNKSRYRDVGEGGWSAGRPLPSCGGRGGGGWGRWRSFVTWPSIIKGIWAADNGVSEVGTGRNWGEKGIYSFIQCLNKGLWTDHGTNRNHGWRRWSR